MPSVRLLRRFGLPALGAVPCLLALRGSAHAESFAEASSRGAGAAFLFAATAGLLTALTPCVYPMIPITISIFGAKTGVSRMRAFVLATFYVAGIAAMFGSLGTVFALLGRAFGTFLANPWVVVPLALFFVAMAFSMFGAFELALPDSLQQRLNQVGGRGAGGAFLMGLVGGIIAAPCTGPPLAGILAYVATTRNGVHGFLLMATYAVGMGIPFWAIAGFSMSLPRSGRWMESVKSVFGIALLVAALYYLKPVLPVLWQVTGRTPIFVGLAGGVLAIGVALGAVHLSFHSAALVRIRKGAGIVLATVATFGLTNFALTPKTDLAWHHSEREAITASQRTGRPLLIDFGATWCAPCKILEANVLSRPEVAATLLQNFVLLKVDTSHEDDDPSVTAIKERYNAPSLPAVRVISREGKTLLSLDAQEAEISPAAFLKILRAAVPEAAL